MIRILHIIPDCDWGSESTQILAIARDLRGEPFDLHVVTDRIPKGLCARLERAGIAVHVVADSRLFGGLPLPRTLSLVRAITPRLIHVWRAEQSWPVALAARFLWRVPLIVDDRLPVQPIEWSSVRAAVLCRRLATHCVRHCPWWGSASWRHDRVSWIPDQPQCQENRGNSVTPRERIRAELALRASDRLVLTVGRLLARKRLQDAIWAADLLKVVRDDVYLFIAGGGPELARLTRFRDQVRIADRVRLLGAREDLCDLMPAADVYWACSEREDVPLALMEAMACGTPCIVSDIPAHRSVAGPSNTTSFFPLGDRAALARLTLERLASLATHEPARNTVVSGYPTSIAAPWIDYAALYRGCLPAPRGAGSPPALTNA